MISVFPQGAPVQMAKGYGLIGTPSGYGLYGFVCGLRYAGGLWRIDLEAKVIGNIATRSSTDFTMGVSVAAIKTLLGITRAVQFPSPCGTCALYTSAGALNTSLWGNAGGLDYLSAGNVLLAGRYYDTSGSYGSWPSNSAACDVGTGMVATVYLQEV